MGLVGTIQGIDSEHEPLDEGGWLVFLEGHSIQDSREYSLHIILLDGKGTDKNFYQFFQLQMVDDKRTLETVLRYSGPLRDVLNNYLACEIGTEEQ